MTTPVYESVAYLAADKFAVFNAAGDCFTSEFATGLRLRADCGTDGVLLGTVASASFDAATGRTVVTTAMDGGMALTASLADVLHGNDLPESLCAHAALHASGGRDALPAASAGVSGLVSLASAAETQAGASAAKAVTPAGLAASAKGLIAAHTTIYVATTGSDATGTGSSSTPYASIAKALSSIAGKLIASGATVIIQVADGAYTINSTIVIDHPDADKIQILGNTAAETTAAIAGIDTTTKKITIMGNYVSNSDAMKNIMVGDIIALSGSSTTGLNGAYEVSGVSYDGTNTAITCASETFASATAGGGNIVIKPCNRCLLTAASGVNALTLSRPLAAFNGFRVNSLGGVARFVHAFGTSATVGGKLVINGFYYGLFSFNSAFVQCNGAMIKASTYAVTASMNSAISLYGPTIIDSASVMAATAQRGAFIAATSNVTTLRNCASSYSPAIDTVGNGRSMISST